MANITFVDKDDNIIGSGTKQEAMSEGFIVRIARVLVFNTKGELLIQKRSAIVADPYRWDQSAAGHVDEGEDYLTAAKRELEEEVGIQAEGLEYITNFYTDNSTESEIKKRFNSLYLLKNYRGEVIIDNDEVTEYKWIDTDELKNWMNKNPEQFTRGFIKAYKEYENNR